MSIFVITRQTIGHFFAERFGKLWKSEIYKARLNYTCLLKCGSKVLLKLLK